MSTDLHQAITDQIISVLETAQTSGRRLWDTQESLPVNLSTGKPYSGINILTLWASSVRAGFQSPYWLTYKQASERGGQVRKGEHGTHCVFYKPVDRPRENEAGEVETIHGAVMRGFVVFNLDQIDGIEAPKREARAPFEALAEAERLLSASPAPIRFGGGRAFYMPSTDT
ncbi:MAG: ArdC-like ssDNA-binding domain-containing protein, partial [Rhodocyclaceae bacterium]